MNSEQEKFRSEGIQDALSSVISFCVKRNTANPRDQWNADQDRTVFRNATPPEGSNLSYYHEAYFSAADQAFKIVEGMDWSVAQGQLVDILKVAHTFHL
jgi:hypothetical protein